MDLYIHDADFNAISVIDYAESVLWVKRYFDSGDFEIYVRAGVDTAELLKEGYFVTRPDDDAIGIIEAVKITSDVENGDYITATGIMMDGIISRRVIKAQTILSGTVEAGIRRLISDNCISSRPFPRFRLETATGAFTASHKAQYTGDNLKEAVVEICKAHGIGNRVTLGDDGYFVFGLYAGIDRSESQFENAHVTFSAEFDNIASTEYFLDASAHKNFAYIAGEGEGRARKIASTHSGSAEPSGYARREIWIDARDASTNDGEVSDSDYTAQLKARGGEALAESASVESFTGEIINAYTYIYGEDYFLGDIVTVHDNYGHALDVRITEVIECEDANGKTIIPKFEGWG